jgi:hypothetical protein
MKRTRWLLCGMLSGWLVAELTMPLAIGGSPDATWEPQLYWAIGGTIVGLLCGLGIDAVRHRN